MEQFKSLGELIKEYREKRHLSQKAFGERIGKTQNTISNYEKNVSVPKTTHEMNLLAKILEVPISTILNAVELEKYGSLEEYEALLINLDGLDDDTLTKKFKFISEGKEISITKEQLKKSLELFEVYERFNAEKN